jgi:hypothetical protein
MPSVGEAAMSRRLNHVELVYAPGERQLAARTFELLGCRVEDKGGLQLPRDGSTGSVAR